MSDGVTIPLQIVDTNGSATMTRIMQQSQRMHDQQRRMLSEGERGAHRLAGAYNVASAAIEKTGHAATGVATRLTSSMQGAINTTLRWSAAITGLSGGAGGAGLGLLLRQGIKLNDEMQRYRITLTTVMHSQAQANAQIAWLLRYAEQTPFQVHGLVEASTHLESFAVNSRKWLPLIGDLASAFGGTNEQVNELVEGVGKLRSGLSGVAFRTFRRFGISHEDFERKGAKFDKGGELTSDVDDAMNILEEIIQDRFGGMMERMRGTYTQVMSNIGDVGTNVLRETVSPLFQEVTKDAGAFLAKLEEMRNDGTMAMLTDLAGNGLADLYGGIKSAVNSNIIQPFMEGQSASDIIGNMLEKSKPYVEGFIGWFGKTLGAAILTGIEVAMNHKKEAGMLGAYFAAPGIVNTAGNLASGAIGGAASLWAAKYLFGAGGGAAGVAGGAASSATMGAIPEILGFGAGAAGKAILTEPASYLSVLGATAKRATPILGALYGLYAAGDSAKSLFTDGEPGTAEGRFGYWLGEKAFGRDLSNDGGRPLRAMEEIQARLEREKLLKFDSETQFERAFTGRAGGFGEEMVGLVDAASRLSSTSNSNTIDGMRRLTESAEGLASKLLDVEERLQSSTDKMPRYSQRIHELYGSMRNIGLELVSGATSPGNALSSIQGVQQMLEKARVDAALAAQEQVMLRAKAMQVGIKGNQGFVGRYGDLMGGDAKQQQAFLASPTWTENPAIAAKMVDDYMQAFKIRDIYDRTGTGGGASASLLSQLGYTGVIPETLTKKTAMEEMIRSAESTGQFSEDQLDRFRKQFAARGGLELNVEIVKRQLEQITEDFKLFSDEDRKNLQSVLEPFPDAVIDAFKAGAEATSEELSKNLGVVVSGKLQELVEAVVANTIAAIRRAGRNNSQSDFTSDPFGSGN